MKKSPAATGQCATRCPGCREVIATWNLRELQEQLDAPIRVQNGLDPRVRAHQVVDAVLAEHVATCRPVRAWLREQGKDWRKVVRACGLPSTRRRPT